MIKNYLKTAWRNILTNKVFSLINIVGLALGITCALLIALWVNDEISYDKFHKNSASLYRVIERQHYADGRIDGTTSTPGLLAEALQKEVPEVKESASYSWEITHLMRVNNKSIRFTGRYASSNFFKLFSFPVIKGNPESALSTPDGMMISSKTAIALFGNTNVTGKTIRIDNKTDVQVKGVFNDIRENSSLKFDYLAPYSVLKKEKDWLLDWGNNAPETFVLLGPQADVQKVNAKIENFVKHKNKDANVTFFLQPFTDAYLYSRFTAGNVDGGRIEYVKVFIFVAILVLLIACINFMNLSTARSLRRAKEIGVRKVMGAGKSTLFTQFLGEAFLTSFIALMIALFTVNSFLPEFNRLTEKQIGSLFSQPLLCWAIPSVLIITSLSAGLYPALFLSSLKPVRILRGVLKFKPAQILFRKGLVVTQFSMSVVLIIGMLVVFFQMHYIRNKNLGYDKDNLVIMPLEKEMHPNLEAFKHDILSSPVIRSMTLSGQSPSEIESSTGGVSWEGKPANETILFPFELADYDYIPTLNIQLKEGRNFSKAFATDSLAVIVNEEAVRRMKMTDPIGKTINFWRKPHHIIGVVKDFHLASMHSAIDPFILHLAPGPASTNHMLIKIAPGKTREALNLLEKASKQYNPAYPLEYEFFDKVFERQYKSELIVESLTKYFAGLAILIASLGLLGLTIFSIEQRTKEIGIRKVLGASVSNIVGLLSKDFLVLVIVAFVIAAPFAAYFMNNWLKDFAYHITLSWWMFCLAGTSAVVIALVTISFQAVKAALTNPVRCLRSE